MGDLLAFIRKSRRAAAPEAAPEPPASPVSLPAAPSIHAVFPLFGAMVLASAVTTTVAASVAADLLTMPGRCVVAALGSWSA